MAQHINNNKSSTLYSLKQKVTLSYWKDFHYKKSWKHKVFFGCNVVYKKYINTEILRCKERAILLYPENLIKHWQHEQALNGYFNFSLPGSENKHVHARIESIVPAADTHKPSSLNSNTITGLFIRHSTDVRSYTFKDVATGKTSTINSTPTHLFYVANRHKWMPVYKIAPEMKLMDSRGNIVSILCSDNHENSCGVPFHSGGITTVYNLVVQKRHHYFVGRQAVLVHNGCGDIHLKPNVIKRSDGKNEPEALKSMLTKLLVTEPMVRQSFHELLDTLIKKPTFNPDYQDISIAYKYNFDTAPFIAHIKAGVDRHNYLMEKSGLFNYKLNHQVRSFYNNMDMRRIIVDLNLVSDAQRTETIGYTCYEFEDLPSNQTELMYPKADYTLQDYMLYFRQSFLDY